MAYTQAQYDTLRNACATGALSVRNPDGSMVTYRSLDEMRRLLADMEQELGLAHTPAASRTALACFRRG